MANVVNAWSDTGELYWKFVSDGWDVSSNNVTCRVHLPVAAGESVVAGDNVRAWGHGPLDASLEFDGNDIVYTVPGVGTDEYAEARVTFPVSWLTGMVPSSISRLPNIRAEEQQWADEANARREQARRTIAVCTVLGAGAVAGIVVLTVLFKLRYARQAQGALLRPVLPRRSVRRSPGRPRGAVGGRQGARRGVSQPRS